MTIPFIPGPEATLGPALAELAKAAGQIIDPNFEFRKTFERALAANPQLLQQLADIEFTSPGAITGAFSKVLSPEAFTALTSTRPSAKAVAGKFVGEALPTVAGARVEDLPEAPTLGQIAATQALTGARPAELERESVEGKQRRLAGTYLASLTPERRAQLGAFVTFPQIMSDEHFLAQLDFQERMFRLRNVDRINDSITRMREANAIWWQQHTGVGSAEDWSNYFTDRGRKRLESVKEGGAAELTPADTRLLEIDAAFQQAPAERRAIILNRIDLGLTRGVESVKEAENDSERAARLAGLNQLLQERNRMGAPLIQAKWAAPESVRGAPGAKGVGKTIEDIVLAPLARFKALRFFDEAGNEVDMETALAPIPSTQVGATVTPPSSTQAKEQRWNALRAQMFPNIPAGQLTPQQIQAVTTRVNAELP